MMAKSNVVPVPTHHRYRGRVKLQPCYEMKLHAPAILMWGWVEPIAGLGVVAKGDMPADVGNRTPII